MELMIRDGDYVPDGKGGFCRSEGSEAVLQRVLWKLTVRRGSFPLLPQLGSRLYLLLREKPSVRGTLAEQYVTEALAEEHELALTGVTLEEDGSLRVALDWQGTPLAVTVGLGR